MPFGDRIDLLAIAPDRSLVLVELKRDRAPRRSSPRRWTMPCGSSNSLPTRLRRSIGSLAVAVTSINVVFLFEHGNHRILSRAWLIDPGETQENVAISTKAKGDNEPWNGEYYVSYGGVRNL